MENDSSKFSAQASAMFTDILDSLIVDVAAEAHRAARLGFDHRLNMDEEEELRLSSQARSTAEHDAADSGGGQKYIVDVFGQTHPAIASQQLQCMNCGRAIAAGRFAPHLEKCMGKGRKARAVANRNILTSQQRRPRIPGSGNSANHASGHSYSSTSGVARSSIREEFVQQRANDSEDSIDY